MSQNSPGFSVFTVFSNTGSQYLGPYQGGNASKHMNRCRAGIVNKSRCSANFKGRQPAAAPYPVAGYGIYNQADYCTVNTVCAEFCTLCHCSGNNRGGSGAEHSIEGHVRPKRNGTGVIISCYKEINSSKKTVGASIHDSITDKVKYYRANCKIHQVFHNNVARVFCSGKARFHHGKAGLHKEYQRSAQQDP